MNADILNRRAELLSQLRLFFSSRGYTEVASPTVSDQIIPERHIDQFEVPGLGYLQASPEMHLKQLLCGGSGSIFEIARCFRKGERGPLHRPEFTMAEWYGVRDDMLAGMQLLDELLQSLLGTRPAVRTSYRDAFLRTVGLDPFAASLDELRKATGDTHDNRDELLNLLIAQRVEPKLGLDAPELLYHFPASQSALAKTSVDEQGAQVAERFEMYFRGVELANGYHELTDAVEMRRRLVTVNRQLTEAGRPALPLPERLLTAMQREGLPECAGVALGFDRLVMLAVGAESIDDVEFYS